MAKGQPRFVHCGRVELPEVEMAFGQTAGWRIADYWQTPRHPAPQIRNQLNRALPSKPTGASVASLFPNCSSRDAGAITGTTVHLNLTPTSPRPTSATHNFPPHTHTYAEKGSQKEIRISAVSGNSTKPLSPNPATLLEDNSTSEQVCLLILYCSLAAMAYCLPM